MTRELLFIIAIMLLALPLSRSALPTIQDRADRIIVARRGYDYAPAIILDNNKYHLYWCAGIAGDFIVHSEANHPLGPWHGATSKSPNSFDIALQPTGDRKDFDGLHTCDPNVIKIGSVYYMYYGGNFADDTLTAVGVARSFDGVHFQRMNEGKPIITAARTNAHFTRSKLTYGAGQPAVLFMQPYFYLAITDSTGSGANQVNGAGQFLLRAPDAAFQSGLQELTREGWADRVARQHTAEYSFLESFGLDWMYDTSSGRIIVATNRFDGLTTLLFLDRKDFSVTQQLQVPVQWREGPALLAKADKTTLPRLQCDRLPVSVVTANGPNGNPLTWDLALTNAELQIRQACMFEGSEH